MARLIPKIDPSTIQNQGERVIAQALVAQLPSGCRVYHSYPWLRPERHAKTGKEVLLPGEADFVIVDPDQGVLILEVKGGTIEYDAQSHLWWRQETNEEIKDPFVQAERNKYALRDRIVVHPYFRDRGDLAFTIGHAVVFPSCRFEGNPPPHIQAAILIDADDLQSIEKAIARAYDAWCPVNHPRTLDNLEMDAILEALSPVFRFTPVLWRTIDDQEEKIRRLTNEQLRLLELLRNQERAAIEGVAGSGKTILAMAQAQRFAREGKRTLLVCYNRLLADWLVNQMPEKYKNAITVYNYHVLVREMCRLTRLPFPASSFDQEFWEFGAPELLERAADLAPKSHLYDAIVVDEGQDFRELWWIGLEKLYRKPDGTGPLYVFYDPKQTIYQIQTAIPAGLGPPFVLPTNCRNTQRIVTFCAEIVDIPPFAHEDAPLGIVPRIHESQNSSDTVRKTQQIVQDWCLRDRGGLRYDQVAVLTPTINPRHWPDHFGNIPIVTDQTTWRQGAGALLDTHRRFKGLEADAIVLAGVPKHGSSEHYSRFDHYVAASRAKHLLEIIYLS
jgi:hypothetical protein